VSTARVSQRLDTHILHPNSLSIGLHPGGVIPLQEHTELENELHEKAHIDYDRVAIVRIFLSSQNINRADKIVLSQVPNPSVAALYEDALVYETGSAITSSGALTAYSGAKTGRSPLDKRIVKEPGSENEIWVWRLVHSALTIAQLTLF